MLKDLTYVSLVRVLIIIGQFVYIKLYTNSLNNYELGEFFFLTTVSYSLNAFIFVPIDYYQQSKIYDFIAKNISLKTLLHFNKNIIKNIFFVSAGAVLIFFFIKKMIALYLIVVILLALLLYITSFLKGVINNLHYKKTIATMALVDIFFKIGTFYGVIQFCPASSLILLVSNIMALGMILILLGLIAWKLDIFKGSEVGVISYREVFNICSPITVGAVANWIQLQGYRLLLVPLGFTEMVGIYSTVSNIGLSGMGAAAAIYSQVFIPEVYKSFGTYTKRYIKQGMLLIFFVLAVSYVFSDFLVATITRVDLVLFSKIIFFGILIESGNLILGVLGIHMTIKKETFKLIKGSLMGVGSMAALLAGIYCFNWLNVYSIGWMLVISQALATVYTYHLAFKGA